MLKLTWWNSHVETRMLKPTCWNSHVETHIVETHIGNIIMNNKKVYLFWVRPWARARAGTWAPTPAPHPHPHHHPTPHWLKNKSFIKLHMVFVRFGNTLPPPTLKNKLAYMHVIPHTKLYSLFIHLSIIYLYCLLDCLLNCLLDCLLHCWQRMMGMTDVRCGQGGRSAARW